MRWLATCLGAALLVATVATADAQIFKPKGKKSEASEKAPARKKSKSKTTTKKKSGSKSSKKSQVADRGRPDDLTPEPAAKSTRDEDDDYVKITDDDEIE